MSEIHSGSEVQPGGSSSNRNAELWESLRTLESESQQSNGESNSSQGFDGGLDMEFRVGPLPAQSNSSNETNPPVRSERHESNDQGDPASRIKRAVKEIFGDVGELASEKYKETLERLGPAKKWLQRNSGRVLSSVLVAAIMGGTALGFGLSRAGNTQEHEIKNPEASLSSELNESDIDLIETTKGMESGFDAETIRQIAEEEATHGIMLNKEGTGLNEYSKHPLNMSCSFEDTRKLYPERKDYSFDKLVRERTKDLSKLSCQLAGLSIGHPDLFGSCDEFNKLVKEAGGLEDMGVDELTILLYKNPSVVKAMSNQFNDMVDGKYNDGKAATIKMDTVDYNKDKDTNFGWGVLKMTDENGQRRSIAGLVNYFKKKDRKNVKVVKMELVTPGEKSVWLIYDTACANLGIKGQLHGMPTISEKEETETGEETEIKKEETETEEETKKEETKKEETEIKKEETEEETKKPDGKPDEEKPDKKPDEEKITSKDPTKAKGYGDFGEVAKDLGTRGKEVIDKVKRESFEDNVVIKRTETVKTGTGDGNTIQKGNVIQESIKGQLDEVMKDMSDQEIAAKRKQMQAELIQQAYDKVSQQHVDSMKHADQTLESHSTGDRVAHSNPGGFTANADTGRQEELGSGDSTMDLTNW